jgi:anti-sigma factor RsiW
MVAKTQEHPDDTTLNEFLDGELDAPDRAGLEAHLAVCRECEGHLAELRQVYTALEAWPEVGLARDLSPAVLKAIRSPQPKLNWVSWVLAIQAVLVIGLLVAAWPFAMQSEVGQTLWLLAQRSIAQVAVQALDTAGSLWAGWLAEVQVRLQAVQAVGGLLQAPALRLPMVTLWALLGSAVLLWLVGNSLLLRPFWPGDKVTPRG